MSFMSGFFTGFTSGFKLGDDIISRRKTRERQEKRDIESDTRYREEREHRTAREKVGDERWEKSFSIDEARERRAQETHETDLEEKRAIKDILGDPKGDPEEIARRRRERRSEVLPGAATDQTVAEMEPILRVAREDSGHNYNALTYGGQQREANLTNMTLDQIDRFQASMPRRGHASTALGGYQFIRPTLRGARDALGLPGDTKFTPEVQDKLASYLVKQRGYDDFKSGRMDENKFARNLSQEWAILPKDASGRSFYEGVNRNAAGVDWGSFKNALSQARRGVASPSPIARDPDRMQPPDRVSALPIEGYGGFGEYGGSGEYEEEDSERRRRRQQIGYYAARGGLIEPLPNGGATDDVVESEGMVAPGDWNDDDLIDYEGAAEAVDAGMQFVQDKFGFRQAGVQQASNPQGVRAYAMNTGAATPEEIQAVHQKVDPDGQLSEDERHVAGYNALYKYYMRKGDPGRARAAVGAMLMASKKAASTAGSIGAAAIEKGDMKQAGDAIEQAYNTIPNGKSVEVTKADKNGIDYELTDKKTGEKTQGKASPDDVLYIVTGMQDGTRWLEEMYSVLGGKGRGRSGEQQAQLEAERRFEEGSDDNDRFMQSLTPEQRKAWPSMSREKQSQIRGDWRGRERIRLQEERAERLAAGGGGGRGTAGERQAQAIDTSLNEERARIAADVPADEYGPTLGQRDRLEAAGVRAGFQRGVMASGREYKREDRDADMEVIGSSIEEAFKGENKTLTPVIKDQLTTIATDIRRGNESVSRERAALLARTLVDPRATPKVLEDGRVQIHPQLPPVYISEEALMHMGAVRGHQRRQPAPQRDVTSQGNRSQAAEPGTTAPTSGVPVQGSRLSPARERMREQEQVADPGTRRALEIPYGRNRAAIVGGTLQERARLDLERKSDEYARLKTLLGDDYRDTMTLQDMRDALEDRGRETSRERNMTRRRAIQLGP